MRRGARVRDDCGVSLIEMLVASAMFFLILAAVLTSLDSGTRTERGQQARRDALVELREAMGRLTKELRQAESIDPASTHESLMMETLISGERVAVTYRLHPLGSDIYELRRQEALNTEETIVTNMVVGTTANPDPPFCYSFDSAGTPPKCIDAGSPPIALTAIRVTLAKDPESNPGEPITLATDVQLRNL
jgi:type II secretory pathway pseudopilin PulG